MPRVQFKPGVFTDLTPTQNSNGWVDSNLVRFRNGSLEAIGGWSRITTDKPILGVPRSLHDWSSNYGASRLAIGTNLKTYIFNSGTLYDITPERPIIFLLTDPVSIPADVSKLKLAIPYHRCVVGDFITLAGAAYGVGNYTAADITGQFQVVAVLDLHHVLLQGTKTVGGTAGQQGGGASMSALREVNTGPADASAATGFGVGKYGLGLYGTPRPPANNPLSPLINQPRIWHMDNFGEDLVLNPRGGAIYIWKSRGGYGRRATLLSDDPSANSVPEFANGIFVSVIGQNVVALGCCPLGSREPDPMFVRWADIENPYDWFATGSNSAGGQRLSKGSGIIGWLSMYYETLIWTDKAVYTMQWLGNNLVYGFNCIAEGISIISPGAAISSGSQSFWMDNASFYVYQGGVQELPCPIKDTVFKDLNFDQAWKICAAHNHSFSEVIWFYPSKNSTEIDRYAKYNYKDGLWDRGSLSRTAWSDSGRLPTPIAVDGSGFLYLHESGPDADGQPMPWWAQSGDMEIDGYFTLLSRIVPDASFTGPGTNPMFNIDVYQRETSNQPRELGRSLQAYNTSSNLDLRVRGRKLSLKLYNTQAGNGFRLGDLEATITQNGKR